MTPNQGATANRPIECLSRTIGNSSPFFGCIVLGNYAEYNFIYYEEREESYGKKVIDTDSMHLPPTPETRFDRVDRHIQRKYIDSGRLAGAQIAIQHRGLLHTSCFGFMDRERTRPMTADCIFRIFSMTKPITSVALMMLVERGSIRLDDPVSRFIPSWTGLKPRGAGASRPMRVVDLLTHCSGLTAGFQYRTDIDAAYRATLSMQPDGPDLETFVEQLGRIPLEFEPGTEWNYSVSTDVLGFLIEKVSGESFRDFLQSRIFEPLGMTDTDFHVPAAKRGRLAECYVRRPGELLGQPGPSFETDRTAAPRFYSGGGGLLSTLNDYLAFCNAVLRQGRRGEARLLSRATWELMSKNHLPGGGDLPSATQSLFSDKCFAGIGFGLGWATTLNTARARLRGTPGDIFWSGMANTFFWCDPAEQFIGIFMTQILPSEVYPLQREIRARAYDAIRPRRWGRWRL
jgi:CubicO group peptidase (beta-lactamase class C family)